MKLRDIMTNPVIRIHPEEAVSVAARMLEHNNIGAMPVCGSDGRLCGILTDRDIVTRCLAAGKVPQSTSVREIMSTRLYVTYGVYIPCQRAFSNFYLVSNFILHFKHSFYYI